MDAQQQEPWDTGPGLLESVWRFRWRVLAAVIAAAALAGGVSMLQPTRYEGVSRLILSAPPTAGVLSDVGPTVSDPARNVRNQAERVTSSVVLELARERIDGRLTLEQLRERVEAEPATELDLITIRAQDRTPQGAAELADAVAESYRTHVRQEIRSSVGAALEDMQERGLTEQASQLEVAAARYQGVDLLEPSEVPDSPVSPRPVRNAATAALLALVAAAGVAWWRGDAAEEADSRHDPARVLGAPLLGEVPDFHAVGVEGMAPAATAPHSAAAEAYGFVLASLESALDSSGARSVLVTSAGPADGKTTTAVNLAVLARRDGRKVLLVDADERVRGLSRAAAVAGEPGLTDLADVNIPSEWCISRWQLSKGMTVPMVPAGTSVEHAGSFFRTAGFRTAIQRLKERGGLLIVDCPPLLAVSDTSAVAGHIDGILLVVDKGTSMQLLEEVRERLDFVGTPLLGYVFNRTDPNRSRYGHYQYGLQPDAEPSNGDAKRGRHSKARQPATLVDPNTA